MYDPTVGGIDEAARDAILNLIVAHLAELNTTLQRGGVWPASYLITASHVRLGDVENLAEQPEEQPLLICVHAAEDDSQIRRDTIANVYTNGHVRDIFTHISVYLHPKVFLTGDVTERRERSLSRICDWLTDGLFNLRVNAALTMASSVFVPAGNNDKLKGRLSEVGKDWFAKSYGGGQQVRGARLLHAGFAG